jgi:2-polyprenyl-3-methyl-5-hydroxy-6-metoxy-1,4-benzoquinol methylase
MADSSSIAADSAERITGTILSVVDSSEVVPDHDRWNHNIHYHPLLLNAVPTGASNVLDVGCGDGMLVRQFSRRCGTVVGIDSDEASIELANRSSTRANERFVCADVMTHSLEVASFDAVVSVAALHHLDTNAALRRLASLARPGGILAIIGIGRPDFIRDLPWLATGTIATRVHQARKGLWEHSAPIVWPPPHTNAQVKRIASAELPGAVFRRHILWRYSLIWKKPA